jgi:hypothetical protein
MVGLPNLAETGRDPGAAGPGDHPPSRHADVPHVQVGSLHIFAVSGFAGFSVTDVGRLH